MELPQEILVKIFSQLPVHDRLQASQTCHRWNHLCQLPQFFRKRHFCLMGHKNEENWQVDKYMTTFGTYIRHLAITVAGSGKRSYERKYYAIEDIFRVLLKEQVKLRSFSFHGLEFLTDYFSNNPDPTTTRTAEILTSMGKLFERQSSLSAVELTDFKTSDADSEKVKLLHSLFSPRTAARITSVIFHEFFSQGYTADPGFLELMGRFQRLEAIGLTYNYLSDNVLTELTKSSPALKRIMLYVDLSGYYDTIPRHSYPDWQTAMKKNHDLRLWLKFICFGGDNLCSQFLVPLNLIMVPLVGLSLEMTSYTELDIDESDNLTAADIRDIAGCINNHDLKSFVLSVPSRPGRQTWDRPELLVDLVQACPALTQLCMQVKVSLDTLIQIRNLQIENSIRRSGHSAAPILHLHILGCDPDLKISDLEKLLQPFCSIRFCRGCRPQLSNPDFI